MIGLRDAIQAQRLSPSSHSEGTASDHELAGLRIWPAATGLRPSGWTKPYCPDGEPRVEPVGAANRSTPTWPSRWC